MFLTSVPHFTAYLFIKLALNVRQHGACRVIVEIVVYCAVCALTILNMLREPHVAVAYGLDFSPGLSDVRRFFMVFLIVQIVLDQSCVPGGWRTFLWHIAFSIEVLIIFSYVCFFLTVFKCMLDADCAMGLFVNWSHMYGVWLIDILFALQGLPNTWAPLAG